MKLSSDSQLTLFPLTIRKDKRNYIVEQTNTGDYFEMPEICIEAIERINDGETLGEIEKVLKKNFPKEEVDMIDFAEQLLKLELVKQVDGEIVQVSKRNSTSSGFENIPEKIGRFFFNPIMNKVYPTLIFINIFYFIFNPNLLPNYQDVFIFDSMTFNILIYMGLSLLLVIIHEFGHIFAIRSHGLPTKMNIGHRLFFVVFETDLTTAWKLDGKERNVLYLAGIYFEQFILFIALTLKNFIPEINAILNGIVGVIILDLFIKFIYQCCFYMKTDMYYLFENKTGCYNLMENGKRWLSRWLPFIKTSNETEAFDGEEKVIRLYSIFYICGIGLTIGLLIIYFIPQMVFAFTHTVPELLSGFKSPAFWDAVVFLGQSVLVFTLLFYSWMRKGNN